ncbi:MAG TPA: high-affinity branched-chain amino acid ABC transporter ATP-binding protein LivG [Spirochaetaceae bacterium]|nr:high-affinity branched-chain amino acid ABC transporter ATP-binding protein LivG [Spirochaetaceae bacterium]
MAAILHIRDLTKQFGGLTAVDAVSFSVPEGGIVGLIGPNGAGKTTIFNLITGIYRPTSGSIEYRGKSIVGLEPFRIADMGITRTFQNIRLFKNLSVFDNVLTACHLSANYSFAEAILRLPRFRAQEKHLTANAEELLGIMNLSDYRDLIANNLPYGLQRRLEIVRALALNPKLLLLDEPAAGMNPDETEQLMRLIVRIRDDFGLSVLVIEHHMDLIMGVCEHIVVLNFGEKIAEGSADEISKNAQVIEAYLGTSEEAVDA